MVDSEPSQENTQCSFDLLAYLVKNNIEAFKIIQDTLKTPEIVSCLAAFIIYS